MDAKRRMGNIVVIYMCKLLYDIELFFMVSKKLPLITQVEKYLRHFKILALPARLSM